MPMLITRYVTCEYLSNFVLHNYKSKNLLCSSQKKKSSIFDQKFCQYQITNDSDSIHSPLTPEYISQKKTESQVKSLQIGSVIWEKVWCQEREIYVRVN